MTDLAGRLWPRIDRTAECWEWTGARDSQGYGRVGIGSRTDGSRATHYVHRVVYELLVGPVPEGLELDHLCRVRHCCRPDHMEPVTHAENTMRSDSPTAVNARKTHCPKGHPYDSSNTWVSSTGWRQCRACNREKHRRKPHQANAKLAPNAGVG